MPTLPFDDDLHYLITTDPEPSQDAFHKRVGSFYLKQDVYTAGVDKMSMAFLDLQDRSRLAEAESVASDITVPKEARAKQLGEIAVGDDKAHAIVGLGRATALGEPEEDIPQYVLDRRALVERQQNNLSVARGLVSDKMSKAVGSLQSDIGPDWLNSLVATARYTVQAARAFIYPLDQAQVVSIIHRYDPDSSILDYLADGDAWTALKRSIKNAPDEETARKITLDVANSILDNAGTIFGNEYSSKMLLEEFLQGLSPDGPSGVSDVFQFLDIMSLIPLAGTVVKAGIKGTLLTRLALKGSKKVAKEDVLALKTKLASLIEEDRAAPTVAFEKADAATTSKMNEAVDELTRMEAQSKNVPADEMSLEQQIESVKQSINDANEQLDDLGQIAKKGDLTTEKLETASKKAEESVPQNNLNSLLGGLNDLNDYVDHLNKAGPRIGRGTAADVVAGSSNGARDMLSTLDPDVPSFGPESGISDEDVVGSLLAPHAVEVDELGRPFIEDNYLSEHVKQNIRTRVELGLKERLQNRLKDTVIEQKNGHTIARVTLGRSNGRGFKTEQAAKQNIQPLFPDSKVVTVEKDGLWYGKVEEARPHTVSDVDGEDDYIASSAFWKQFTGMSTYMTSLFQRMTGAALIVSEKAESAAREVLHPYLGLNSFDKAKINKALWQGMVDHTWWKPEELFQFGIYNDKLKKGYLAVKEMAQRDLSMTNFVVRKLLKDQGFENTMGGTNFVRPVDKVGKNAHIVNIATGNTITKVKEGDVLYELFSPTQNGTTHFLVRKGVGSAQFLEDLPLKVVKDLPGYFGTRHYQYPYYVFKTSVNDEGSAVTSVVAGARSEQEGARYIADNSGLLLDGEELGVRRAKEVSSSEGHNQELTDLQLAHTRHLMLGNHRKVDLLDDGLGRDTPLVRSVEDTVNSMVRRYGDNAGYTRFNHAILRWLNQRYGMLSEGSFDLYSNPVMKAGVEESPELSRQFLEAKRVLNYLQRNMGLSPDHGEAAFHGFRQWLAEKFWKTENSMMQSVGDNISGLSNNAVSTAKSATFAAYLGLNFTRQPLLQSSMIPTYLGIRGAAKYAARGQMSKDWTTLAMSMLGGDALARKINPKLVQDWQDSGLSGIVFNHLYAIGSSAESAGRVPGILDDTLGRIVRGSKMAGFDIGITNEKMSAFLIARNRFLELEGKLPSTDAEIQQVAAFAEKLSMNMNRADRLPYTSGALGTLLQFRTHQFKYTGRLLGQELGFERGEKIKMALAGFLSYGFDWLRMGELVDSFEEKSGVDVSPIVEEAAKQGAIGFGWNAATRAMTGQAPFNVEAGEVDLSAEMAPGNFVGPSLEALKDVVEQGANLVLDGFFPRVDLPDISSYDIYSYSPPFVSLGGTLGEALKFTITVLGGDVPVNVANSTKAAAITAEWLRVLPITDEILKSYMATSTGYFYNTRGEKKETSSTMEAFAALFGIPPSDRAELNQAWDTIAGEYQEEDTSGIDSRITELAKKNANYVSQVLAGLGNNTYTKEELLRITQEHAVAMSWLLPDEAKRSLYFGAFWKQLSERGAINSDQFIQYIVSRLRSNDLQPSQSFVDWVKANDFPGSEQLLAYIKAETDLGKSMLNKINGILEE